MMDEHGAGLTTLLGALSRLDLLARVEDAPPLRDWIENHNQRRRHDKPSDVKVTPDILKTS
jgi:hypothetical protein